jgi:hypothetical protein
MWFLIGLLAVVVVLGLLLDRRRRGTGTRGEYGADAPYGPEAAASRMAHGGPGLGGGGASQ